eukprot:CAMPEP_0181291976 /NCGR_PEP_ID=MMETSP1101-20121128/2256_1 /TAXON_ID=46948 /ORGANISM="Rhodomonas abbreviata, Strain Caron Lab Isolate" /LENGTH=175 /DNA_ID=CAMNT_0023396407 /DNA_START=40 /DNA_END=567 /DNA_ORIENTATION=-
MLRTVVVSAIVASAAAFQAPSAFLGSSVATQAACRSSAITMSAADDASVTRRAALASILAGAAVIPGAAHASYNSEKGKDANWQLKQKNGITDVQSSSMSGTRTSAFGKGVFGNTQAATYFEKKSFNDDELDSVTSLTNKVIKESAIAKKGYKTSNKIGINPAFGGSSGVFTGAE